MECADKWLVCSGAGEYLPIAGSLVAAGCTGGIEWEPVPARACSRLAPGTGTVPANVVVGAGLTEAPPLDVASSLAGMAAGSTVLCVPDAVALAELAAARGVTAAVEPAGLVRLLLRGLAGDAHAEAESLSAAEEARGDAADEPAMLAPQSCDDLEEPCAVGADGMEEHVGEPTPRSLRTTGSFSRVGVEDPALVQVQRQDGTVASPAVPGLLGGMLETEPVVYRPVVDLGVQRECPPAGMDEHVPTICFASARGGVGRTALAVLSAIALAREGMTVALIDLNFQFGTCLGYLGAESTDGLFDMGTPVDRVRIDARSLARCRVTPESGLVAYEFCQVPEQAEVLAGMASDLVRAARAGADVAVVDLPVGVDETVAQVLDLADRCLFVTDQRPLALESLAVQQELCARMGVARTKLATVMNRCDPRHRDEGFLSRVRFEVQTPQVMQVVDGGADVAQMLSIGSAGELFSARNRFALSAADMAHALCVDMGCLGDAPTVPTRAKSLPAASDRPAPVARESFLRRRRREKQEEEVACPF